MQLKIHCYSPRFISDSSTGFTETMKHVLVQRSMYRLNKYKSSIIYQQSLWPDVQYGLKLIEAIQFMFNLGFLTMCH